MGDSYRLLKHNCTFAKHVFFFFLRATNDVFPPLIPKVNVKVVNIAKARWNLETLNCPDLGSGVIIINDFAYHDKNSVFVSNRSQSLVL